MREAFMKRRTEIIVIGVVAVAAAVFAMKRGEIGLRSGGAARAVRGCPV